MMQRISISIILLCLAMSFTGDLQAEEGITIQITVIKGLKQSDKPKIDEKLKHLANVLETMPYARMELVDEQTVHCPFKKESALKLMGDVRFAGRPIPSGKKFKMATQLYYKGKRIMKAGLKLTAGKPFIMAGPGLDKNSLIVAITVQP